jgi:hypothetical protein
MPRCSAAHSQVCKWWVVKSIRSTDPQRTNNRSGRPPRGKTQRGCRNLTRSPRCWSRDHHAIRSAVLRRYAQSSAPTCCRIGFQGLGRGVNVPSRAVPATSRWEGRRVGLARPSARDRHRAHDKLLPGHLMNVMSLTRLFLGLSNDMQRAGQAALVLSRGVCSGNFVGEPRTAATGDWAE